MNAMVRNMQQYEQALESLIASLKQRGVSDAQIKSTLIQKGHPRVYVSMMVDSYDTLPDPK
jgi:uncharacterized protein (DUF111 family)